jgi:diguanylate cyclase (GGDEF)-like protein
MLCSDVVDMLAIDLSDDLPQWLSARIRERSPALEVHALRILPGGAARVKGEAQGFSSSDFGVDETHVQPLRDDALLLEAVEQRARREGRRGEGSRHVIPLHAAGEVRYVLDLVSPAGAPLPEVVDAGVAYFERLASLETDPLTRLRTRRVFQAHVSAGLRAWVRSDRAHYVAVLDVDRFKRINDEFGHLYGDEILVHFANVMRRSFRAGDLLYRFGGEEFVLVYAGDRNQAGEPALERFRQTVEAYEFPGVGRVTVSIGFARISDPTTPAGILVDRADQAVYYAKANGRNQVRSWERLVEEGLIATAKPPASEVTLF